LTPIKYVLNRSFPVLYLIFIFIPVAVAQEELPDSDFQVWNETKVVVPLRKEVDSEGKSFNRVSFLLLGTLRLGQNRLYPVDKRIGAGLDIRLNKNFSISPTYYYRSGEELRGRRDSEHRLRMEVNYDKKWSRFGIKDRNRIEYRIRHSRSDSVRYRHKFTFAVPVKKDGKEMFGIFAADEQFYDLTAKRWSRNEFSAGISRKLSPNVSAEFFYLRQDNSSGTIRSINAVGMNLKIEID
jgi:hypothetical protein